MYNKEIELKAYLLKRSLDKKTSELNLGRPKSQKYQYSVNMKKHFQPYYYENICLNNE